jgi:mRNA interferase RelE/StbE
VKKATVKYILRVPDDIAFVLKNLHPIIKSQIRSGLEAILDNPYIGKALKEELKGLRSYKVKRYRIIYRIRLKNNQVEIITIGPRSVIYNETFRILSKNQD